MIFKTKKKNIKKNNNNFFDFIKNLFAIFFSIQIGIFILLIIWYFNNPIKNIHTPKKITNILNQKTKNLIGFDVTSADQYLKVYLMGTYYSIFKPKIDKIDLNINQKNLLELEFQRKYRFEASGSDLELKKKLSKYVNGSIKYNGKKIPIKIRVKGDRKIHYDKVLSTSYKIDIRKGKKLWGLEEFSLQKPIVRNYAYEYIFHKLHHELGNISLKYKLVDLSINGLNYGIYSIEEGFSKELIERHSKRNGPIYGIRDDLSSTYPDVIYDSYSELYWVENNIDLLKSGYGVLKLIKENNADAVEFIDWEAWGKFFAVTDMVEAYHGALAKSVRIYYNPVSGKIEPISFDGHHGTADFSNFIILDFLSENPSCSWICKEKNWFLKFLIDENNNPREEFLSFYLKYLNEISSEEFLKKFDKKYSSEIADLNKFFYSDFSGYDNIFWEGIFPYVYKKDYLEKRAKKIQQKLNSTNISNFLFSKNNNTLDIKFARESNPIKIISSCEKKNNTKINTWIHKNKTISWPNECEKLKIETVNKNYKIIKLYNNPVINNSLPTNLKNLTPIFDLVEGYFVGNTFYLKNDTTLISINTILPKKTNLKLKSNQKIILENGSTLVLFGNLYVSADKNKIAMIEGAEPNFGSIISINNIFNAKNLGVKKLTIPKINGFTYFAGINIFNSEVNLKNVTFINSQSEDTLNLIESESIISNIKFIDSKSDALDIDGGSSNINNLYCRNIGNDCLDFSNTLIVAENIFAENIFDKSISIGENSKVKIKNIKINNSEIGLAVKDNSDVELISVDIQNSKLPIAVFVKKNEYGPAKLIVKNFNIKNSNENYLVDDRSQLIIDGKIYTGTESGKVIESYLYGNIYGKATTR